MENTKIWVRYGETDQMGVVYHSNYFRYFEQARSDFFKQLGYSYKRFEQEGFMLPLTSCQAEFKAPAKYDDNLEVEVTIEKFTGVRIELAYSVFRYNDGICTLLVSGKTAHAIVDHALKPINIKKAKPEFYNAVNAFFQAE